MYILKEPGQPARLVRERVPTYEEIAPMLGAKQLLCVSFISSGIHFLIDEQQEGLEPNFFVAWIKDGKLTDARAFNGPAFFARENLGEIDPLPLTEKMAEHILYVLNDKMKMKYYGRMIPYISAIYDFEEFKED